MHKQAIPLNRFEGGLNNRDSARDIGDNFLAEATNVDVSSVGRIRTPFIKLTVGDWCNRVPGILNSLGLSWNVNYPWEIKKTDNILMLPHVLDVSVQFTPIHNFMPEKSINAQFISKQPQPTQNKIAPPASNTTT